MNFIEGRKESNIEHLSLLARLGLTCEEKKALAEDLERILEYVGELSRVSTEGVEPMAGGTELVNRVRKDEERIDSFENKDALLSMAPDMKGGYFRVPRILD